MVVCEYCSIELATGQRFRVAGQMVCAACAKQVRIVAAKPEKSASPPDESGFDALAAAVASAHRPGVIRPGVRHPGAKRKSGLPTGLLAFGITTVILVVLGVVLVQSGAFTGSAGPAKPVVDIRSENERIREFNTLMTAGNALAGTRDFRAAVVKFRQAREVALTLSSGSSARVTELDGSIAQCEALIAKAGSSSPSPDIQFMERGAIATEPAQTAVPQNQTPRETPPPAPSRSASKPTPPPAPKAAPVRTPAEEEATRIDAFERR